MTSSSNPQSGVPARLAGFLFAATCLLLSSWAGAETAGDAKMVEVAAGAYPIGAEEGTASARPVHTVTLEAFDIDVFEVTNAQFAAFLNRLEVSAIRDAEAGTLRPRDLKGPDADRLWGGTSGNDRAYIELDDTDARIGVRNGRFAPEPGFVDHPVTESTWQGARAFCASREARLPTEAEWEAAARGRSGRRFPWGNTPPTPEHAVYGRARGDTDPVGSHPNGATPAGVFDLAGNEAEWTSSLYKPYPYDAKDGRENPDADGERVTRGGDHVFDIDPRQLTGYFRDGFSRDPRRGHRHIGFRCARDRS